MTFSALPVFFAFGCLSVYSNLVSGFESVGIGGGGYIDGVLVTPAYVRGEPNLYIRTDVGGMYRLQNSSSEVYWVPLSDSFGFESRNLYGNPSFAVSGSQANTVYRASGGYADEGNGVLFYSLDAGDSWLQITPTDWAVPMCGNSADMRGSGERLVVNQANDSIVMFASFFDGLWKGIETSKHGWTWRQISCGSFPCSGSGRPVPGIADTSECDAGADMSAPAPYGAPVVYAFPPDSILGKGSSDVLVACVWNRSCLHSIDFGETWSTFAQIDPKSNEFIHSEPYSTSSEFQNRWMGQQTGPSIVNRMSLDLSTGRLWAAAVDGIYYTQYSSKHRESDVINSTEDIQGAFQPWVNASATALGLTPVAGLAWHSIDVRQGTGDIVALTRRGAAFAVATSRDGGESWNVTFCKDQTSLSPQPWDQRSGNLTGVCSASSATVWVPDGAGSGRAGSWPRPGSSAGVAYGAMAQNQPSLQLQQSYDSGLVATGNEFSTWFTTGVLSPRPVWWTEVKNEDETFVMSIHSPASGPALLLGTADLGGFIHYNYTSEHGGGEEGSALRTFPPFSFWDYTKTNSSYVGEGLGWASTLKKSSSGEFPEAIVRVSAVPVKPKRTGMVAVSTDGGFSWDFRSSAGLQLIDVAVAPGNGNIIVVEQALGYPIRSIDGGHTWSSLSASLPYNDYQRFSGNRYNYSRQLTVLPTLHRSKAAFVHVDCKTGTIRLSSDGAAKEWSVVQQDESKQALPQSNRCQVVAVEQPSAWSADTASGALRGPADATTGLLFVAAGDRGLFRVDVSVPAAGRAAPTDVSVPAAGRAAPTGRVVRLEAFEDAHSIGWGLCKGCATGNDIALFVHGKQSYLYVSNDSGPQDVQYFVYGSPDLGSSWIQASDSNPALGNYPTALSGSLQHPGLVAIGSMGRGAFFDIVDFNKD